MGWLREFMSQAGLRSFGELARQALAHPEWPEDTRAQTRSLEAILGRLDRLEDLDWLSDRPGVQQILATVLKVSVAEIRTVLLSSVSPRNPPSRLRLDDLRVGRSFSALEELLPPSIPERVALPATWTRCCWAGPPGSGFGLAGAWLSARGLAHLDQIQALEDMDRLPRSGPPLYVELSRELLEEFLRRWRGTQPLCLAVPTSSPLALEDAPRSLELLKSPPIDDCLDSIFDWVLARVSTRKDPGRKFLMDWLRRVPLSWGILESFGDVVGVLGACLEGSIEPNPKLTKEALLRQWMDYRTEDLARERHRDITALRRTLPEVLIDIAQTVLVDETRSLQAPRTIDEWLNLVPEQHRRGPDIDWLTTRLVTENLPMRKLDLERAAQRLPPGAHRLVVALRELQLLQPISITQFALRPHFLGRLAYAIAKDRVVSSSPLFWGEALLRPFARKDILAPLELRAEAQPESLAEDLLEQLDLESPALVSAFETGFILLGLAALSGAEVGDQQAASLLAEQAALTLTEVGPIPCARTTPREPSAACDLPGALFLAAWALSEQSKASRERLLPELDPWRESVLPDSWPRILDAVCDTLKAGVCTRPAWLLGAIRLLDRLRHTVGAQTGVEQAPHPLFLVGALLDAAELGVLEWSQVEDLMRDGWQLDLLMESLKVRRSSAPEIAQLLLSAWRDAGHPAAGTQLLSRWPAQFFAEMPAALLAECLLDSNLELGEEVVAHFPATVWQAWSDAREKLDLQAEPCQAWRMAPQSALEQAAMRRAPVLNSIRRLVWERCPEAALRSIDRCRATAPDDAAEWLVCAPLGIAVSIAQHAKTNSWLRASPPLTRALARVLYGAVSQRVPDWTVAYEYLSQLEAEKRRFSS